MTPRRWSFAALAACLCFTSAARAQRSSDGVYDRLSGDLALQLDAGAASMGGDPAFLVSGVARFVQTAGLYVAFNDDFRAAIGPASRALSLGVELRPLFLPRMTYNLQQGPAVLDLLIDSFALRAGAVTSRQPGFDLSAPGLELALGFGVPFTRSASGPWLSVSGALRWSDSNLWHHASFDFGRAAVVSLTLGWQGFVRAHIVDVCDTGAR